MKENYEYRLEYEVIGHVNGHRESWNVISEWSEFEVTSPKSLKCKRDSSPATLPPREIRENLFTKNKVQTVQIRYNGIELQD